MGEKWGLSVSKLVEENSSCLMLIASICCSENSRRKQFGSVWDEQYQDLLWGGFDKEFASVEAWRKNT
jgi:hypothetical protein